MPPAQELTQLERLMSGVLAMLVAEREDRLAVQDNRAQEKRKTEVILFGAGFSYQQIGVFLDKKPDTVKKSIARAKAKPGQKADEDA